MKPLDVGAAVIVHDGKILITQRDKNRHMGGKWEFPGGKIEAGEPIKEGLAREILEELGVEIEVGKQICVVTHNYPGVVNIKLHTFLCKPKNTSLKKSEHEDTAWVDVKNLLGFDLAPADIKAAKFLLNKIDLNL